MNNAVSLVPAEIWLKIAIYLRDYIPCSYGFPLVEKTPCYKEECGDIYLPDLYDLARTCRFLWKLLLPLVYHRVAFENGKTTWKNDMYMALGRQPGLWQSVKEIRLYAGKGPMHQRHQDMIAILRPLRNLPAMRKLKLNNVPFSASVIEGLMSATSLNTLIVGGGEWLWDVPHNWSQSRFGSHLRSLEVTRVAGDDFAPPRWMQLVVPSLCRLRVGNSTEGILIPLAAALKTRFVSLPNLKTFITVEVQETNVKIATFYVHSILDYLPQLEELFLGEHVNEVLEELSNDSLPALKFIGGHIFNRVITKLVGRPGLEALQSNYRRWDYYTFPPQDAFRAENIKTLYWPESTWWEETGEHLAKLFPNVEVLSLTACEGADWNPCVRDGFLPNELKLFAKLRSVYIAYTLSDEEVGSWVDKLEERVSRYFNSDGIFVNVPLCQELVEEREAFARLRRDHCSQLELVRFTRGYAWVFHESDGTWWPAVRPAGDYGDHALKEALPGEFIF